MRAKLPLVSVGLPTFNRVATLERSIASVLAQNYPSIELVISDNASTDATAALCMKYASQDPRVRYFRQPHNRGPAANFVEVLERARGEFFMWLGDDDWLDQSYVQLCVDALRVDPRLSLVAGTAMYYRGHAVRFTGKSINLLQDNPVLRVLRYYAAVGDNSTFYGVMPCALARRIKCRSCIGGDWLFVAALAYLGKVKTLQSTALHRDLGGASETFASLAAVLGLPSVQKLLPYSSVALNAMRDIANRNPVYRDKSALLRSAFAGAAFFQIMISKALLLNMKTVVVGILRSLMGDARYRRVRERIRSS